MLLRDGEEQPSASDAPAPPANSVQPPVREPTLAGTGGKTDNRHKFARTMLGLAPIPPAEPAPPNQPTAQAEQAKGAPSAEPVKSKHQTMLGLAFSLPQPEPRNQAAHTLMGHGEFTEPTPIPVALPLKDAGKGTLIGVAIPGVAPINPGVAKPLAQEAPVDSRLDGPSPSNEPPEPTPPARGASHSSSRALLWALSGVAVALALVSVAAVLRWRAVPKLDVRVESDEAGNEALRVECGNCDDGTVVSVGDVKGELRNHLVRIPLRAPLRIGENAIDVSVARGSRRPEIIKIRVPVDFRVTGDTTGLDENPAKLRLRIEKTPTVQFQVEHTPVNFDPAGRGVFELDISNELIGPSPSEGVLEKRLSYQVQGPNGTHQSSLLLRAAATPLIVTSPGSVLVTEGQDLKICGRTDAMARVEIAGLQTRVDKDGQFCNAAVIREFGQFEVWISAKRPAAAPRKVKISIERTASLREYAKRLFPQVNHQIQQEKTPGQGTPSSLIALTGVVVEQSKSGDSTRYLLKYDSADGARFARVNSFSASAPKTAARVTVFGEPVGTLDGPDGRKMEELNAAFDVPALR